MRYKRLQFIGGMYHITFSLWKMKFLVVLSLLLAGILAAPRTKFGLRSLPLLDGRIVGGAPVLIEEHPYIGSIQLLGGHWCGGSIISNVYIVSAAHCFDYPTSWYTFRAGSTFHNTGGQLVEVGQIFNHPNYNPNTADNDIAIVVVSTSLVFGAAVASIPLPVQDQYVAEGTQSVVSGWGALTEGGAGPVQLQAVSVPIISRERCNDLYSVLGYVVTDAMICAGYDEGGRDACQGDSGGPLTINGQLIGVVSWGEGCARPLFPGVFSSVPHLRPFIAGITGI